MSFNINFNDLVKIIKAYGYDDSTAKIVADYLDECIEFEMDLTYYLWNALLLAEALDYIEENLTVGAEDCTVWEGNFGTYLEW